MPEAGTGNDFYREQNEVVPRLRHSCGTYYTRRVRDLFRKRWWAECWNCDFCTGPFPTPAGAHRQAQRAWGSMADGRDWCCPSFLDQFFAAARKP